MKTKILNRLFIKSLVSIGLLINFTNVYAIYTPVAVTGFNADVVADIAGNAAGSTNNDFDGVNYVFMSQSYNSSGSSYLPVSGIVNSAVVATPGLTYQLQPYTANNSLRMSGTSSGTLTLTSPISAQTVYILGSSGSGASTTSITVTFTDATTQVFTGQAFADWYNGTNYAILGLGRCLKTTNVITNDATNPRLYQVPLVLLASNYTKLVASVSFSNTGGVLNVMAVSVDVPPVPCTGTPTAGNAVASNNNPCLGTSVTVSLSGGSIVSNLGYQWQRSSNPPNTWTSLPGQINSTFTFNAAASYCYRCIVTCLNSGLKDTSQVTCITTLPYSPFSPCYCYNSNATNTADEEITNVTMGTLNNSTTCATPFVGTQGTTTIGTANLNADFSQVVAAPTLYKGSTQTFSLTVGSCGTINYTNAFKIYIDFNRNNSFTDAGEEVYFSGTTGLTCIPATTVTGSFVVPTSAGVGLTRMRIINQENGHTTAATIVPCGTYGYGETEDYVVKIIQPDPYDPSVTSIVGPTGNCFTTCESVTVAVNNNGMNNINLVQNPVTINLKVNGPNGLTQYTQVLSSGILNNYGGNSINVTFPCVNLYAGGTYSLNTNLTIGNSGGVANLTLSNDSISSPLTLINYRPTPGPQFEICQNQPIGFGQGMTVTGCGNLVNDSIEIVFNVNQSCIDNVGATTNATSQTVPGAGCANIFAGDFGSAVIPALPVSNPNFLYAVMTVSNFTLVPGSVNTEVRFHLYKNQDATNISNIFNPIQQGTGVAPNITATGLVTAGAGTTIIRDFKRNIPFSIVSQIMGLGVGAQLNMGYWETWNDLPAASDITLNQGGTTEAKLKIYYNYVPSKINWYDNATSTIILDTIVPFNPLKPTNVNPTTQMSNTSVPNTYTFFATCDGNNCRVPVNMIIHPTPSIVQDTMSLCEDVAGSNQAVFILDSLTASVGLGNPVTYYTDAPTLNQIIPSGLPLGVYDTTSTVFRYAKVTSNGCSAIDSVLLQVYSQPQFQAGGTGMTQLFGNACAPSFVDVTSMLGFPNVTAAGSDTLFYADAACTMLHPNPHTIYVSDTVWIVLKTKTTPACTDTAVAYIEVTPALGLIAGQTNLNFSTPGSINPVSNILADGQYQMYYQTSDCKKVASVHDLTNGIALGATVVDEEISSSTLVYNNQPYVNRVYQVTPTTQDSAEVCLFYLEDDINIYNQDAPGLGFTTPMTSSNFTITQTHNGNVDSPNHTFTVIPNSAITSSYDPTSTVWTLCFKVDSFSYFYLHTQNPVNAALPITLLSFTGKRVENTSLLKWSTSSEQNNAYFEIERSKDARNFNVVSEKIASQGINGNSNTILNYTFTDMIPNEGHNYYRLKQTDKDGKTSNAKNVVDVYFGNETMVTLYPNPAHNELNMDINISKATNAKMKIMDATGRVVKQIDMPLKSGGNQLKVSLDGLSDGMYMVQISNDKGLNYSQTIRKN